MGAIIIGKKVEVIGLFVCLIIVAFLLSSNALESSEFSLRQIEEQQEKQNEVLIVSDQQIVQTEKIVQQLPLAQSAHGQSIESDSYIQEYLQQHNYFEDLQYTEIVDAATFTLEAGNAIVEDIQGVALDNQGYAIHLIICDEETQSCYFRINGVPTGKFIAKTDTSSDGIKVFEINDGYTIEIVNITFNDSGDKRFYDVYWDKKNIVELKIVGKGANREVD